MRLEARDVSLSTGVRVHVSSAGDPHAPPVVLIHGLAIHSWLWRRNLGALVDAGYHAIAADLPGHGLSERPHAPGSYTLGAFTRHTLALLDALGISRAPIIAQSMGGRVALELAHAHPERVAALALFGSVGLGAAPKAVALAPMLPVPGGPLSKLLVRRWMVTLSRSIAYGRRRPIDPRDTDAYWAVTQSPGFLAAVRQTLVEFDWRTLTPDFLATITAPALVVFGTRDRTVRPANTEALVRALPHGELYMVRDAGHVANEEAFEEVNPLLVEFLRRTPH